MNPRLVVNHMGPNSPEKVAFDLMERVAFIEGKRIGRDQEYRGKTDRTWLLNAFADCRGGLRCRVVRRGAEIVGPARRFVRKARDPGPGRPCARRCKCHGAGPEPFQARPPPLSSDGLP